MRPLLECVSLFIHPANCQGSEDWLSCLTLTRCRMRGRQYATSWLGKINDQCAQRKHALPHTHTRTHTHTHSHSDSHSHSHSHSYLHSHSHSDTQTHTHRQTDTHTNTHLDSYWCTHKHTHTHTHTTIWQNPTFVRNNDSICFIS